MKLSFQKLESDPKKGNIISFSTEMLPSVSPSHFITIKRPLLDEEIIERMIRSKYAEQIAKGLFSKEMEQKMKEEIKNSISNEEERILKLPHPIIFYGIINELKFGDGYMNLKAQVSLDTAFYILENIKNIEEMEMEIVEYPSYLSGDLRDKKIDEIIEEFLENNPYSKSEVLQGILGRKKLDKVRDGEILRKPRSEERPFTPVSLHDVPLDDQEIENEKPSKKKKKSRRK